MQTEDDARDWPAVAFVETDRFCDRCGYNLRTQSIRRDPRTEVLMCRCPECGRFHAATDATAVTRRWLLLLATPSLALWMLIVACGVGGLGVAQGTLNYATLDLLTRYQDIPDSAAGVAVPFSGARKLVPIDPSGVQRVTVAGLAACSVWLGFVGMIAAAVVFYHWPRRAHLLLAMAVSVLTALVVGVLWQQEAPDLVRWSVKYNVAHVVTFMIGGALGAIAGRGLVRIFLRVMLPPRLCNVLAFLWLVDGEEPPGYAGNKRLRMDAS